MVEFGDSRVPERIWAKLTVADTGCWLWSGGTGGKAPFSYGVAQLDGKLRSVHRWMYGAICSQPTDDEHVHHVCEVTLCCNPAHLVTMPISQHMGMRNRNRTHCPKGHPYSGDNLQVRANGWRVCRHCNNARQREAWQRKRNTEPPTLF
jgi:hypothetical protein